ncbi:hypothetical protein D3OALGA1CA_2283 [Olavius algarvensis associated proteobacterium Delta 3]|nr:hypothetical protein D3OALGA1CA_2283 [Olavius algarvensis associated proteobacterium Delta 3]CAB5165224.1 hypothetical protein D3OALGB2SA_5701 [Olavius algarvensis associated proteobacterium Delta 3]
MIYQNYEQVKELNSSVLKTLLSNGDAQERVWAAWEIGLRLGREALPNISLQAHNAPDAGTRRHMVVVLAGLGHYSVLSTLAKHDPDESVRGTTTQYLIRITDQNDTEKISLIINILEKDKSPVVMQSILDSWDFDQHQIPILLLLECARNKSEVVRNSSIRQIVKNYGANDLSTNQIVFLLADQRTRESNFLFLNWLLDWDLHDVIILSAEKAPQSSKLIILDFLVDKNLTFSWETLKNLSQIKIPDTDIRILSILKIENNLEILLWLAFGLARAINLPKIKSHSQYLEQQSASNFYDSAKDHFLTLIKVMVPQKIDSSDSNNFQTIMNHLENDIEYFDEYDDEDFWEDEGLNSEEYIKEMEFNCTCIKKWLSKDAL